jgi:uncharacterized protein YerC
MIKEASSDLNSHSLLDGDSRISDRLSHQKVKTHLQPIKIENHEQRCLMKFLFLQEKRYKAIHGDLSGILGETAASLATVERWCRCFKDGNASLDDKFRSGRRHSDIGEVMSQFLIKEPFLSGNVLAKRLPTSSHTIEEILTRDLGLRTFTRRWVPHDLSPADKAKRVIDAWILLRALKNDQSHHFSQIMTEDEGWLDYNEKSPTIFARAPDQVLPRASPTICSKQLMVTIFLTANRLLKLAYFPQ